VRGMIVAAGRGTRLRPLTDLCPKPALPVRGVPLVAWQLAFLAHHGVREVVVNTHHLPEVLEETARRHCPPGLALRFSREDTLLDTGGAIRRVAGFLRESDPCVVIGGDMVIDVDLGALVRAHGERRAAATLLLRDDARADRFGTVGVDREGVVRRIGSRFRFAEGGDAAPGHGPAPGETRAGVYTWVNVLSRAALDTLPDREVFSHFDGWLAPRLAAGARDVHGVFLPCLWEPVGTLAEYLAVQWTRRELAYLDVEAAARAAGARVEAGRVIGAGAELGAGASLDRVVVWEGERVPAGFRAREGVYAGGRFHAVGPQVAAPDGNPESAADRGGAGT